MILKTVGLTALFELFISCVRSLCAQVVDLVKPCMLLSEELLHITH